MFLQELDTLLASLVEKGVAAEADVVQQLRQVLPAEVMDLVPSEFKRWAPCTACWAEDGMPCSLRGAALCLAGVHAQPDTRTETLVVSCREGGRM